VPRRSFGKAAVFGATSGIARAVIRRLAAMGTELCLVGRGAERLEAVAQDARVRGAARVTTLVADLDDVALHGGLVDRVFASLGPLGFALLAQGILASAEACEEDPRVAAKVIHTDFLAPALLAQTLSQRLVREKAAATVAVLASVAGDRGRATNYVYGAAKGGLAVFLEGLRHRMDPRGVHILTVKPGPVDTPMTAHLEKTALFATPDRVARDLLRGVELHKDVVYTPGYWRLVMAVLRLLPERLWRRLRV
jgi:decaprenylphospho-beta-D-erythro-pentofuranosid-2-ulose 2-reductase